MMPMSAVPAFKACAQPEGMVYEISKVESACPCSKSQRSGAVFRYEIAEIFNRLISLRILTKMVCRHHRQLLARPIECGHHVKSRPEHNCIPHSTLLLLVGTCAYARTWAHARPETGRPFRRRGAR